MLALLSAPIIGNWWKIPAVDDKKWRVDRTPVEAGACSENLRVPRKASADQALKKQLCIAPSPGASDLRNYVAT